MNKTAIKNFAIWARTKLIADVTTRAMLYGVTAEAIQEPLPQSALDVLFFDNGTQQPTMVTGADIAKRRNLVEELQRKTKESDYKTAFKNLVEEVAYTWFNRLIAVRFMEVNDYLPSRMRVLSSASANKLEPDFVTSPLESGIAFLDSEQSRILALKQENKLDELFRMLFVRQCNDLHQILPELFEKTNHYTELLLTISFADRDGVVYRLTHDIEEDDFNVSKGGQVEIIGWMYQYYNSEPKDKVFADLKKNIKISKETIPAATQLFTPDWIVRYMVENSVGRLWLDGHADAALQTQWKYFIPESQQEPDVEACLAEVRKTAAALTSETVKVIDPCMGSGHILVYAFDVMMQIYQAAGYAERDAASLIIANNLFGLDLDKRAYQLAYFALMMKARQYDRRFFARGIAPNLDYLQDLTVDASMLPESLQTLTSHFANADTYGSLLNPNLPNLSELDQEIDHLEDGLFHHNVKPILKRMARIGTILTQKYDAVITNPPYMGSGGMSPQLADFVKANYPDSKSDLFAVFIERGFEMVNRNGYSAMVTMQSWMFLSSYEKLREKILDCYTIECLAHMANMVMGIAFGTSATVWKKQYVPGFKGAFCFIEYEDIENGKPKTFPPDNERNRAAGRMKQ